MIVIVNSASCMPEVTELRHLALAHLSAGRYLALLLLLLRCAA